jgi:UDP:flavonoid glycosyltransferase YjiC (YdhE family)
MAATASETSPPKVPANAYLARYLPGAEAARRSQLVVCNGGNMSTQQALAEGVPVLAVASNLDQVLFARAVAAAGAGEVLKEGEVSEASVRRAAWRVLKWGGYAEAARRIAQVYEHSPAASLFPQFMASLPSRS